MHSQLIVQVSKQTGLSFVQVSHEEMWELVEQLSNQRAAVNYTYQADCFTVSFLHLDVAAAQKLLDEWNPSECAMDEEAPVEDYAVTAMMR
jgi:hypothetical protein